MEKNQGPMADCFEELRSTLLPPQCMSEGDKKKAEEILSLAFYMGAYALLSFFEASSKAVQMGTLPPLDGLEKFKKVATEIYAKVDEICQKSGKTPPTVRPKDFNIN